ncbi:GMC family oxidoreductase N-terminal domain-containing protein [Alphaproteobacteria bacterium]|jgi:choline dehydrogenase|nr:GMC family oxidoreductase N-terminal domain-containing protein [Alphaproteobacteria bacterium]
MEKFDYIIVGSGSSGSVIANRLSEINNINICVLEAGGTNQHPFIKMPAGFIKTINDKRFNWCFKTEASQGVNNREIFFPRGKGFGGSSSINGHLYVRGQPDDYNQWAQLGNLGWGYDDILPYFKKSEYKADGNDEYRGKDGPLFVTDIVEKHPICEEFIKGSKELGIALQQDYNSGNQEGIFYYQRTIKNGMRFSASDAFLKPALKRKNLEIHSNTMVLNIIFENKKAIGLVCKKNNKIFKIFAEKEIILCAGAIGTPHLLQVSGVGNPEHLKNIGVSVVHENKNIGEGLQDHYAVRVSNSINKPVSLNERARGYKLALEIMKWFILKKGLISYSPAHVGAFLKSSPEIDLPDLQFVFTPASYTEGMIGKLQNTPGITCGVWQSRPHSRGYVKAISNDINAPPLIQPNYLKEQIDQDLMIEGVKRCRALLKTSNINEISLRENLPGKDIKTDKEILDYIRNNGGTVYHAIGSCRMGIDNNAVVNSELKVNGIQNLRIADASIMPTMPSGNTNAATMMIAEKASDLIKKEM